MLKKELVEQDIQAGRLQYLLVVELLMVQKGQFTKLKKQTFLGMTRDFYIKRVLPLIGGLLSKNFLAYTYLPNSIDGFLTKEDLVEELEEIGFDVLEAKGYSMDISTMFVARK
jgi:demethylmenaquinone methyltransferase/2-methoxy-6-polyprenyl-1,4-benzoquinol methylase